MDQSRPTFRVHPSLVLELGAALITDRVTALLELVKNSYDADSPDVQITVETTGPVHEQDTYFPRARGTIVVEDSGCGMDWNTIKRGWLTVAHSLKREMKAAGKLTPGKKRTPLGDKGLGRLGAQLLGRNLEIYTCSDEDDVGYHLGIAWDRFSQADDLENVEIWVHRIPKRKGTKLVISDLNEPGFWASEKDTLQRELSQVFFPFGVVRPFVVKVSVDGERLDLAEMIARIRENASFQYRFVFDGEQLVIDGNYRLNYLESQSNRDAFARYIQSDNGSSLFAYLQPKLPPGTNFAAVRPGWFVETKVVIPLRDLSGLRRMGDQTANPGPFGGEIDYFELSGGNINDVFNDKSTYRNFVKENSGLRVYRDGFAIRPYGFPGGPGHDWLKFGQLATGTRSSYFMKVQNTVGYVAISAGENGQLTETTSREGFQETPYVQNFRRLLEAVIAHINTSNYQLRTLTNEFLSSEKNSKELPDAPQKMRTIAEEAKPMIESVASLRVSVDQAMERIRQQTPPSAVTGTFPPPALPPSSTQAVEVLSKSHLLLGQIENYVARIQTLADDASQVEADIQRLRDQVEDFTELAALGLAAEALTHEISNIADGLRSRTRSVLEHLKTRSPRDPVLTTFANHTRHVASALRKQLSHLTPSLRYVREEKDLIEVREFLSEHMRFFRARLEKSSIRYVVEETETSFKVRMNRGKLTQVLDNLVLNSEYWLIHAREEGLADASIHTTIKAPYVQLWDTGLGIHPAYENSLFEPFVTGKPRGQGRGLGLYIIRQLLDSDGCRIALLPQRNRLGRRFIFQIDLSGAYSND